MLFLFYVIFEFHYIHPLRFRVLSGSTLLELDIGILEKKKPKKKNKKKKKNRK